MRVLWRHYADAAEFREIVRPRYNFADCPVFLAMIGVMGYWHSRLSL